MRRARDFVLALAALGSAVLVSVSAASADPATATYAVTVTNLTGGQSLTPPTLAIHRRPVDLFDIGAPASFELKEIAENGNLGPMFAALDASKHVYRWTATADGAAGPAPIVPASDPGGTGLASSQSFTLEAATGAKYLSFASMLICTNDGFTGLDALRLPKQVGDSTTAYTGGYDAGTEVNTEDFADLVPPCPVMSGVPSMDAGTGTSDPALAENGVIRHHPGIAGGDDLDPSVHGWTDPVARVYVERIG